LLLLLLLLLFLEDVSSVEKDKRRGVRKIIIHQHHSCIHA
jgi:hypothetical protein